MLLALIFGLFGLIVGSFLNVLVLRHGITSLAGRSGCLSCGMQLRVVDLIPIVSWFLLRGRCRTCGSALSLQYPLVELATAVLFGAIGYSAGLPIVEQPFFILTYVPLLAMASILIAIAAYDIRHTIIPDRWVYFFAALAFVLGLWRWTFETSPLWLFLASGPLVALPLFALWAISHGRWMGFGDVKLCLGIGWLLGPLYGIVAVMYGFIFGGLFSVFVLLPMPYYARIWKELRGARQGIKRSQFVSSYTMKSEVAFGPFLILGCLTVWLLLAHQLPVPGIP